MYLGWEAFRDPLEAHGLAHFLGMLMLVVVSLNQVAVVKSLQLLTKFHFLSDAIKQQAD